MESPEAHRTTKHEGDMQTPDRKESPLTSRESQEVRRLNPEQAMQDEEKRLNGVLTSIAERIKKVPKEAKLAIVVLIGTSALTFGQGSFQEAHAGQRNASATEDVFNRYSGQAQEIHQKYTDEAGRPEEKLRETQQRVHGEMERIEKEGTREVEGYKHQKETEVTGPGIHIRARQGYGGKGPRESLVQEHRSIGHGSGTEEQMSALTMRALRILYDIPDRKQAKYIIEDFAKQTGQDVGDAAEMLSGEIPRLANRLNNRPDDFHDAGEYARFLHDIKTHPGIQEVIDSARFKIAHRPKGSPPR